MDLLPESQRLKTHSVRLGLDIYVPLVPLVYLYQHTQWRRSTRIHHVAGHSLRTHFAVKRVSRYLVNWQLLSAAPVLRVRYTGNNAWGR